MIKGFEKRSKVGVIVIGLLKSLGEYMNTQKRLVKNLTMSLVKQYNKQTVV